VLTIRENYEAITEVNRSKFIATLVPMSAFDGLPKRLKTAHPKSSHVVYAYRHLNTHDQIVENSSDDGEPRGAAGTPILNVLRGEEAIECAVVIVRYFGGIKLGIGGMVRAYTLAAQKVIREADWHAYFKPITYAFESTYRDIQRTEYHLAQSGITQFERTFVAEGVRWSLSGSEDQIRHFCSLSNR